MWPAAVLLKEGVDPLKDVKPVTLKGHASVAYCSLNGDVDAAVVFQDARNIVKRLSKYIRSNENSEIYGENSKRYDFGTFGFR